MLLCSDVKKSDKYIYSKHAQNGQQKIKWNCKIQWSKKNLAVLEGQSEWQENFFSAVSILIHQIIKVVWQSLHGLDFWFYHQDRW